MSDAIARIDKVISAAQNQLAACSTLEALGLECRLRQIQPSLEALRAFKEPPPDCYSNGEIESKYAQANWDVPRYAVGVGGSVELFPQIFGFNADPDAKSLSRFQLRAEAARVTGWFEVRAGLNFGRARANPDDPALRSFIAPSVSFAVAVASLSSDSLYKDNKLNLVNGTPPPRLSLGFDAQFEYGLDRPETQVTGFQKVVLTAFADFRFTDTLGFRLGIPLSGALVTRDADTTKDPPVTEQSDLQWKVPVFVTTVLKM